MCPADPAVEAGGCSDRVVEQSGAFGHQGLAAVRLGHGTVSFGVPLPQRLQSPRIFNKTAAEGIGQSLAGQVIVRGAETSGQDQKVRFVAPGANGRFDPIQAIRNRQVVADSNAPSGQLTAEPRGVGIDGVAQDQFIADRNKGCLHGKSDCISLGCPSAKPTISSTVSTTTPSTEAVRTLDLDPEVDLVMVLGPAERNLKKIRNSLDVTLHARGRHLSLSGPADRVDKARLLIEELVRRSQAGRPMDEKELSRHLDQARPPRHDGPVMHVYNGNSVQARTEGQAAYLQAIKGHDLVFCSGPAGSGKTYLAVAAAVAMLKRGDVRRLVLARPAVEAGEKLGFLPGDLQEKVNPYLRPLLDALYDMIDFDQVQRFMHSDVIEIVPLAFMRGRTLNDAAIILDEAQNTTPGQMLMFLTRMGLGSKAIVTGDTSQVDLEPGTESGLIDAARRLGRVSGVSFVALGRQDIVRHDLVQKVVEAYDSNSP